MFTFGVRAHDYGRRSPDDLFRKIKGDGWTHIQLAYQKAIEGIDNIDDINWQTVEDTIVALEKNNLTMSVFGAYVEPAYVDEELRKSSVERFKKCIPFAKALKAGCVGTETTNYKLQPNATPKEALDALKRSLGEILIVAEDLGVVVAVEPVYYHTMATPEITRDILHTMKSDYLKVIFDPINILDPEKIETQHSLWESSMEAFGDQIAAVHIKGAKLSQGMLISSSYEDSVADYRYIFNLLKKLPQDLPILREEAKPEQAKKDLEFLKSLAL